MRLRTCLYSDGFLLQFQSKIINGRPGRVVGKHGCGLVVVEDLTVFSHLYWPQEELLLKNEMLTQLHQSLKNFFENNISESFLTLFFCSLILYKY